MNSQKLTTLSGNVDSIVYKNEENGFVVLMLNSDDEPVTVVGEIGDIDEGEELNLTGEFINHQKFGTQFKVTMCERSLPKNISAIQKYLASGVIKGIGPVLAKSIVTRFGEDTFDIFENDPDRLTEVEGLTVKKAKKFAEEFRNKFAVRRLMSYLTANGISSSYGVRAWKCWGESALEMVQRNPYALCSFGVELPFVKADELASSLDFPPDNDNRVKAGIINVLSENANNGHTCLPLDKLEDISCRFLSIDSDKFNEMLRELHEDEYISEYIKRDRKFEMLRDFAIAEMYISRRLNIMRAYSYDNQIDFSDVIDLAEEQNNITYEDIQRQAINTALSLGFLVLTGGPGTGKTTTLNAIISLFQQQGLNVMIAAPTGRAAKRISDLTGFEAKTIHRMLEVKFAEGDKPHFSHNENNLLGCDVMIVDEMSMVDTLLFEALLRALPLTCKLIMVGDSDQLPSVGAGNVLKDIIDSGIVPTIILKEIFRQAESSKIVTNAHRIVRGEQIELGTNDDFFFFQRLDYESLQQFIVELCKTRLPKAYHISPTDSIQILSPTRQGPSGTIELNRILQNELNPPSRKKTELKTFLYKFRAGDKVMQTRNNYDITWTKQLDDEESESGAGIFNGDIGTILKINKVLQTITIDFDGRICNYTSAMLDNLELAYAVTVHKSQGSEFDYVILTVFKGYDKLYYRNLLYTAVTRAKKMLIIVGSKNRIDFMINNNRRSLRYTCLKEMLAEDNGYEEIDS